LGTILSSDKTNISAMTGNRIAHPLLISLANLDLDFRMKSSHRAFLLLALLPIPKFIHRNKKIRGVLGYRLFHECFDFIMRPLKIAASIGVMMNDPLGYRRYCFMPLASCIVDTPESALYACVGGKTSSVTMATFKTFGNATRHEPRTASTTLAQLQAIEAEANPWDLPKYIAKAKKFRLNGVHRPFWRDWPLAEPSLFLTPEPLHHLHKMFWDHDAKWSIRALGEEEIDFRFSVLQPHTGFRHFKEGISEVKQVTGREHRDVQRYMIGVIAGAILKDLLIALHSLMDFRYSAQAHELDDESCNCMITALKEFHDHKAAITDARLRVGKHGKPIEDWSIPKLELMQSVVPNVRANGVAIQWSADVTEHAHITEIKHPADATNNNNYEPQICRYLDRLDKCRRFDLATSLQELQSIVRDQDFEARNDTLTSTSDSARKIDYFEVATQLEWGSNHNTPRPFRTFASPCTAFHLAYKPSFKQLDVDDVALKFQLPDLRPALADYLQRVFEGVNFHTVGGRRRAAPRCQLPFQKLEVWSSFRIQRKSLHNPGEILEARTVNASPPNETQPFGHYDTALINTDRAIVWPGNGLKGCFIMVCGLQH
jgi:Plavaka transposase